MKLPAEIRPSQVPRLLATLAEASTMSITGKEKSKVSGMVKRGNLCLVSFRSSSRHGTMILGSDIKEGSSRSSVDFPPKGRGREKNALPFLNLYKKCVSLKKHNRKVLVITKNGICLVSYVFDRPINW